MNGGRKDVLSRSYLSAEMAKFQLDMIGKERDRNAFEFDDDYLGHILVVSIARYVPRSICFAAHLQDRKS